MAKYQTMAMLRSGKAKDELPGDVTVPYMATEGLRAPFKVTIVNITPGSKMGRLFQGEKLYLRRMDTSDGTNPEGKYLFAMDGDGNVYAGPNNVVKHHSAFLAGGPIAAAGHIKVEQGRLVEVDNDSGHYWPPHEFQTQFLSQMEAGGVDLKGVKPRLEGHKKADQERLAKTPRFKKALERLPK